jgi:MFS family permease
MPRRPRRKRSGGSERLSSYASLNNAGQMQIPSKETMNARFLGLPRNVFVLGVTSFFNDFSSEMVFSVLPAFFISVLKSGAQSLGVVEGIAEAASNLIKIVSGRWSDRIQRRKIFAVFGYGISVLSRPFYVLATSVGFVVALRLIDRVGKGLRDSPRDALISLSTPDGEAGRSFGYHRAMDTLGAILGPLVAFAVLSYFPGAFNVIFLTAFILGLAAVASLAFVTDILRAVRLERGRAALRSFSWQARLYLVAVFVLSIGGLPLGVLLFKTQDLGIGVASIPLFYAIYNVTYAGFSWPAGRMADQIGTRRVIVVGYGFLILAYVVLSLASAVWILVIGFLLLGLFSALTDGVQRSYLSNLVAEEKKGAAYGYLNGAVGFGALIAGVGGGYVWQHFGDTIALLVAAGVVLAGLAFLAAGPAMASRAVQISAGHKMP